MPYQIDSIYIRRQGYDDRELTGEVKVRNEGGNREIEMKLSQEQANRILAVMADALVESVSEMANDMRDEARAELDKLLGRNGDAEVLGIEDATAPEDSEDPDEDEIPF